MYETEGGLRLADFEEKRMAGDYEVFEAISIGTKEIVMGESPNAAHLYRKTIRTHLVFTICLPQR